MLLLEKDICYLRTCLKNRVKPKFIKITGAVSNSRTINVIEHAEMKWLRFEIKYSYGKLADVKLELDEVHVYITSRLLDSENLEWLRFVNSVLRFARKLQNKKRLSHKRKLDRLIEERRNCECKPKFIPDFVVNQSNEQFTDDEMNLLD